MKAKVIIISSLEGWLVGKLPKINKTKPSVHKQEAWFRD
ncbi:hypothetical protein BLGI_4586 [Brevibacillus laterosporus GI-9]|nr:hypothetical protein BLGI_4586 [Brevibacillus laterosporus GI-9]